MISQQKHRNKEFINIVKRHYMKAERDLPWRKTADPYHILVSEVMLQQTQVERVKGFYEAFLLRFPSVKHLAEAQLSDVLMLWKGLGYNRRAVNLKKAAEVITQEYKGEFPREYKELINLPGIGQSTAGALMNFAFNILTAFIETNIRSVYLHHFFEGQDNISDKDILSLIEQTQDMKNPRDWYYALYDYGTFLKKSIGNQNSRSKHYKKQSAFKGSNRELRSLMLSYLLQKLHNGAHCELPKLIEHFSKLGKQEEAILKNIDAFIKEGIITQKGKKLVLA